MGRALRVEADGGSRGNPGVAGYGALVRDDTGRVVVELAEPLGTASNNVAEYRGMIAGLEAVLQIDPGASVEVAMDSKLVVEQMEGRWKIKHADMRELALRGRRLVEQIEAAEGSVRFTWIPRAQNSAADLLSNRGMDGDSVSDWVGEVLASEDGNSGPSAQSEAATLDAAHSPLAAPALPTEPTRVVLVAAGGDRAQAARGVGSLIGSGPASLLVWDEGATVGDLKALGAVAADGPAGRDLSGDSVSEAWRECIQLGGFVVVAASPAQVREVVAEILEVPPRARERLSIAAGSLTAIEAQPDGAITIAFVGRT